MQHATQQSFVIIAAAVLLAGNVVTRADLAVVGPIDPVHGFPKWFQDSNGVALEIAPPLMPDGITLNPYSIAMPPLAGNASFA
jgi:hypothetical protein